MALIGVVLLVLGALTYNYSPAASPEIETRCREILSSRGEEMSAMTNRCSEKAFAGMFTAGDAKSAAQSISSANQSEIIVHMASMFALGLGSVFTLMGLIKVGLSGFRKKDEDA